MIFTEQRVFLCGLSDICSTVSDLCTAAVHSGCFLAHTYWKNELVKVTVFCFQSCRFEIFIMILLVCRSSVCCLYFSASFFSSLRKMKEKKLFSDILKQSLKGNRCYKLVLIYSWTKTCHFRLLLVVLAGSECLGEKQETLLPANLSWFSLLFLLHCQNLCQAHVLTLLWKEDKERSGTRGGIPDVQCLCCFWCGPPPLPLSLAFRCFSALLLTTVCIILEVKGARSGCTVDLDSDGKLLSVCSKFLF